MNHSSIVFPRTHLARLIDQAVDATVVVDASGEIAYWNAAAEHLFGYSAEQAVGRELMQLITPERFQSVAKEGFFGDLLRSEQRCGEVVECLARCQGGTEYWVEGSFTGLTIDNQRWVLAVYRNAHARKTQEQLLRRLAITDTLSGLCNRGQFQKVLEAHLRPRICVAILDIDQFKVVNDTYGHPVGDDGIRFVADQLRDQFQDAICLGRLGGDEFGVISEVVDLTQLVDRFELLRDRVASGFRRYGNGLTVSVGLVFSEKQEPLARELWTQADTALYRAKARGRNRVEVEQLTDPAV